MKTHLFAMAGMFAMLSIASKFGPAESPEPLSTTDMPARIFVPKAIPAYIERGMDWLAAAQYENGGWGAGSHSRQDVRDPHTVSIDPATTAFSAMALMRSGSTITSGKYRRNVSNALNLLLDMVENAPDGDGISNITGTQPQAKLGQNIDVSMVTQFLSEVLVHTAHDAELNRRTEEALSTCLQKLQGAQDADGSWNSAGGWAGVLQSAMANSALEMAQVAGADVNEEALDKSREYQKDNVDSNGRVRTDAAAGVSLYAISGSQRATAKEARRAQVLVEKGAKDGMLSAPVVSADNLKQLGFDDGEAEQLSETYRKNRTSTEMLQSETVLSGFGNNGGEEFLSYMMTSESLVLSEDGAWDDWFNKMNSRLSKIQNQDGSWSGHHCITSPVFCTAAVIMTMTADRGSISFL
ncbi:MAG TPA: prenyltransferase/squalene oxidase repeat-containing protein [Rhodothermales bacterium]|nr:prenyltransferase/squalene oxidase repeat-containing protein [Rhodothermales bacterium]